MRRFALVLAGSCLFAAVAAAQAARGRIDGVVTDSVHASALPGALVMLARRNADVMLSRSTTTDSAGRFAFDSLPPGEYVVALESAMLDSLELALPPSTVTVDARAPVHVRLAVPSGGTIRARVCPRTVLPSGIGALIGRVADAGTGQPLRGAVLIGWSETTVDPATLRSTSVPQGARVESDSLGRFLVCGVPTDTYLDLRASSDAYTDALLQVVIPDDAGVARQDIALGRVERTDATVTGAEALGTVGGTLYGASAPLPQVLVQVQGDSTRTATDSLGRFRLGAVPLGTHVLELRRVGYLPRQLTIEVRPGLTSTPEIHLTRIAMLDSVRVVAQRTRLREFESRAKVAAFGNFLRAEDIERRHPRLTSDLLQHMPDFVVWRDSTSDLDVHIYQSGGPTSWTTKAPCEANIVIDGVAHQMINWIDPQSIAAMEIYRGVATGPIQYRSPCGTILIWTKR